MSGPLTLLINIDVPDLETGLAFYLNAFDLRPARRFGSYGIELLGGSSPIYLLAKPAGSQAASSTAQRRDYGRHWTPVHLDLVVSALEPALARAKAAGAVQEGPTQDHVWGRIAHLADPFGNGFCLIEMLGRGYDEIADPPA